MIREVIRDAFYGDKDIIRFFDPACSPADEMEAADIVADKISEHLDVFKCKFVSHRLGYFFYIRRRWFRPAILISFCVRKELRTTANTKAFWDDIKKECGNKFICVLYTRNSRAINWLVRMGMGVHSTTDLVTTLKF